MAFPAVVGRNVTSINTDATSHAIQIGSPANGTLVIVLARVTVGTTGISWPGGWTELVASNTADASNDATAIAYRLCDGTEGATISVSCTSAKLAALAYEITGAADPGTQAPQVSTIATGTSDTPDPSSLTPTGGAKDYLWLWMGGWEGEQTSPPASNPANYTDPQGANTGTSGAVTTNCRVAIAERNLNASSEDPGSWTLSASDDWSAWTMAIHPAGAAPTTVTPAVVATGSTIPTPAVSAGAAVTPAVIATNSTIPTPLVSAGAVVTPVVVATVSTIPTPTVSVLATFDLVQQKTGGATSTTLTVTLDATPTVGNTLIARVASRNSTRVGHVTGFKPLDWNANGNGSASVWYRQVQSGDGAAVELINAASAVCTMHVEEVVGQLVPHRSANRFDGSSDVTTFGTGVTAAIAATGLALAFVAHRNVTSTGYSWADSYTLRTTQTQGSGTTGVTGIPGDKVVTSGTQEGVLSWTTAARPWSCIGVLVEGTDPPADAYSTEVLSHSPFSYYRLDDPGAAGAADTMGNVHLRYSGGHTKGQTGVITGNPAVLFDGINGLATEDPSVNGWATYVGDCTVCLWVKTPDPNQEFGSAAFLSQQDDFHGTHAFMLDGTGEWNFHYRDNAVTGRNLPLGNALTDTWEFFAWTIGAAGVKVYSVVAGVVTEIASATDITQGNFDLHQLGKTQGTIYLEATIDEVAVWHSVLTSTDLQDIFDASGVGTIVAPAVVATTSTVPTPTITAGAVVAPAVVATTSTIPTPTIQVAGGQTNVAPAVVATTSTVSTPTVSAGAVVAPAVIATSSTVPTPTIQAGVVVTPATVTTTSTVPTPTVQAGAVVTPNVVVTVSTVSTPTVQGGVAVQPATVVTVTTIPTPTVTAGAVVEPDVVVTVSTVPTPVIQVGEPPSVDLPASAVIGERNPEGAISHRNREGVLSARDRTGTIR